LTNTDTPKSPSHESENAVDARAETKVDPSQGETQPEVPRFARELSKANEHGPSPTGARDKKLGAVLLALGSVAAFLLMAADEKVLCAPLWGGLCTLVAAAGVLSMCGLLRAETGDTALGPLLFGQKEGEPAWMAPRVTLPVSLLVLIAGGLAAGAELLAIPIALALAVLLLSALRRPALFVFVAASLLLLPTLGQFGLWDPWETHYGEVTREILARDDWITLWWAQDEWFRSKPILIFWMEALSWGAMGMGYEPDSNPAHPEWAIRLPHYVLTMAALMACYAAVLRTFGRRAAVIASLVLATTPYFFLLGHQAITDMPFVSTMTVALALYAIAVEAGDESVTRYRLGPLLVSAQNVLLLAFVMIALPQALYLISRNLTLVLEDLGFFPHFDEFMFGSAGNGSVPGNSPVRSRVAYLSSLGYQPFVQGILWLIGLYFLVQAIRREKRLMGLAMFGFYLFCSLSWMAKGIPGFALPGLIVAMYLFATKRFPLLLSGRLRVGMGILTIAVTGLPWYVAMYGRLGPFFTDRLLIHDHINRLAQGVHGDTGSIQYFLWQLGYGAFPWIGLFPLGFAAWMYLSPKEQDAESAGRERRTALLFSLWAAAAFTLFNAMITKFHHYIFPAVPPLSLLTGIVLARVLGPVRMDRNELLRLVLCTLAPVALVLGVGGLYGDLRGVAPADVPADKLANWVPEHGLSHSLCALLIMLGLALLYFAFTRRSDEDSDPSLTRGKTVALSLGLLASSAVVAFAGRDFSWVSAERPTGNERMIQLFIYNYGRPFPDYLDYRPILSGFAVVIFAALLLATVPKLRRLGVYTLLASTFWFSVWSLDVYLIDLTPHWGQRELIKRYYENRNGNKEPLIAWQMNWKGENIYTGNHVHVFVQLDNKQLNDWMGQHTNSTAYFLLEHSRLTNFKRALGKRHVEELSTMRENNKFILVRARI
jgi:4-amino-4-deoxy-L-arabinose transferase-like glycosyltransferase